MLIQQRREQQGRSIRQAALMADLSDAYWGQVEKGYVVVRDERRPVTPSRRALLSIADSLRLSQAETKSLLESAGHKGYVPGESQAPREAEVDLTGLSRKDLALLNAIADRFREAASGARGGTVTPIEAAPPLRRVARGKAKGEEPAVDAAVDEAVLDASKRNPARKPRS